jgi:arsenical pump membrane protein
LSPGWSLLQAIDQTGLTSVFASWLSHLAAQSQAVAIGTAGLMVALGSNLVNNLPMGLFAGSTVQAAHVSDAVAGAVLIGVNLGPNLSLTGSLATIPWLTALRREGVEMGELGF